MRYENHHKSISPSKLWGKTLQCIRMVWLYPRSRFGKRTRESGRQCPRRRQQQKSTVLVVLVTITMVVSILVLVLLGRYHWSWPFLMPGSYSNQQKDDDHPLGWAVGDGPPLRPKLPLICDDNDIGTTNSNGSINQTGSSSLSNPSPTTNISWNYCAWTKNLKDCLLMLQRDLSEMNSWIFIGSNEMATLAYYVSIQWRQASAKSENDDADNNNQKKRSNILKGTTWNVTSRRNSCQNLIYYGVRPPNHGWTMPDHTLGEGPIQYGKDHPWCMDCRHCWNVLLEDQQDDHPSSSSSSSTTTEAATTTNSSTSRATGHPYLEYLAIPYARDVSIPSIAGNTTIETASYYLKSKQRRPQVCVAHTGMLDAEIPFTNANTTMTTETTAVMSTTVFRQNMVRFIRLLQRSCENVVWVSLHGVVESDTIKQNNCQLRQWNNEMISYLYEKQFHNVYVVDIWEKSLQSNYVTNLKLGNRFHSQLARLFVAIIVSQEPGT